MPRRQVNPEDLYSKGPASGDRDQGYWHKGNYYRPHMRGNPGNKPFIPESWQLEMARRLSSLGVPQISIASLLKITIPTLHKYFREELDEGKAEAIAIGAQMWWDRIRAGDGKALQHWMAIHAGWVVPTDQPERAQIEKDVSELTDDELNAELAFLDEAEATVSTSREVATRMQG